MSSVARPSEPVPAARDPSPFAPIVLVTGAVTLWFAFQTIQFFKEGDNMRAAMASQEVAMQNAKKLRDALDRVARDTQVLADQGNENAKLIVDELRRRGITINPNAPPPASPAVSK